jgi:hypothetical protein
MGNLQVSTLSVTGKLAGRKGFEAGAIGGSLRRAIQA